MKKIVFFVLSALLFSVFIFMVKDEKESKLNIQIKGDSFIEGLKMVHKNNGHPDWTLSAKEADLHEAENLAYLNGVQITLEGKDMAVFADKGTFNMATKNLSIDGNITAKGNSFSITAEHADLDSEAGTIKSESAVKLDGKKMKIEGKGILINNKERKVRVLKDVKATFYN